MMLRSFLNENNIICLRIICIYLHIYPIRRPISDINIPQNHIYKKFNVLILNLIFILSRDSCTMGWWIKTVLYHQVLFHLICQLTGCCEPLDVSPRRCSYTIVDVWLSLRSQCQSSIRCIYKKWWTTYLFTFFILQTLTNLQQYYATWMIILSPPVGMSSHSIIL